VTRPAIFDPQRKSLLRGSVLVLGSVLATFRLSRFPEDRPSLLLILPAVFAFAGLLDTLRCVRRRWSLYHAGVLLLLCMDLMALAIILFLLLYPYAPWANPR
jgi:UDP-N-acetylmuramyl pentapeptide phosphotransferase/UDP-N-acetylglucosamine-1-phosphate transferase